MKDKWVSLSDYFGENVDECKCKEIILDDEINNINELINKKEESQNGTK